jgi:hypothetical protein
VRFRDGGQGPYLERVISFGEGYDLKADKGVGLEDLLLWAERADKQGLCYFKFGLRDVVVTE